MRKRNLLNESVICSYSNGKEMESFNVWKRKVLVSAYTLFSLMEQINHHGSEKDKGKDGELTTAKGVVKDGEDVAAAVVIPEANGKE